MPDEPKPDPEPEPDPKPDPEPDPEDLGDAGKRALARERSARKAAEARAKELEPFAVKAKELEEAGKTAEQKANDRATAAEAKAADAELRALRSEVASEKGLTPTQAKRLIGKTKEELEADADELLESFGGEKRPVTGGKPRENLRGGGEPGQDPEETDPRKLAAQIPRTGF